jgi:Spy/CpxP family protein refolding chaperone
MWKQVAPLLIAMSLAMNAAVAGTWGFMAIKSRWPIQAPNASQTVWSPLHRQLNVTEVQWRRLEPEVRAFQARAEAVCEELSRLRSELLGLIAADAPAHQAIAAKQAEIHKEQERMQELVIEHLLVEKAMLTPVQQDELFRMMRERGACSGPGRMWGFGAGQQQDGEVR